MGTGTWGSSPEHKALGGRRVEADAWKSRSCGQPAGVSGGLGFLQRETVPAGWCSLLTLHPWAAGDRGAPGGPRSEQECVAPLSSVGSISGLRRALRLWFKMFLRMLFGKSAARTKRTPTPTTELQNQQTGCYLCRAQ